MNLDFIFFSIIISFGAVTLYNFLSDKYQLNTLSKLSKIEAKITFSISVLYSLNLLYHLNLGLSPAYIGKSLAFFVFFVFLFYNSIKEKVKVNA